ncbi:MAG TPA: 2,3-bisphosphoglycerate-dependent phosphoglycerate mutase [Patescibacteria group bacterium]|nr:2,3-bisphosphoglycerate-dependent phosphoglycerate mutase [Patescibacteria group bacterium]
MATLVLVRHGESEYNAKGVWTGWDDPDLSTKGIDQANNAGKLLEDIHIDCVYTSQLKRTEETLGEIAKILHRINLSVIHAAELNERNYGIYTGKNKWEIEKELGEEEFKKLRRGWDYPIPQGESLKQVYKRAVPYFQEQIIPKLISGENVAIISSGNALRAIVKYLENIPEEKIPFLEIATGEIYVYQMDENGKIVSKEIRKA